MLDPNRPPPRTRFTIVRIALQEVGKPTPDRIREYHSSALGRPWVGKFAEWCGIFCLAMLHESGVALKVLWRLGGGFCEEQHLARVKLPEPGDVAYYDKPFQHHALVQAVDAEAGTFSSVDGNQAGDTVVLRTGIKLTKPTCFYSIEKLLMEAAAELDTEPAPPPDPSDPEAA